MLHDGNRMRTSVNRNQVLPTPQAAAVSAKPGPAAERSLKEDEEVLPDKQNLISAQCRKGGRRCQLAESGTSGDSSRLAGSPS